MVEPKASKGQTTNIEILVPAVMEATAVEPKVFTEVCRITLPIAVIEY
jgi:hypothetical protein